MRMIQYGDADVMVAGGAEYGDDRRWRSAASARRARCPRATTSRRSASRPWDKDRDGFVLSDGAGVLVLEDYEHARKARRAIYCELVGFGMSADAHHIDRAERGRRRRARCMSERR